MHQISLPETRRPALKRLLDQHRPVRALECHNALSALVATLAEERDDSGNGRRFDALWASGFAHATTRGLPDAELSLLERRIDAIAEIATIGDRPIIADVDTGGDPLAFATLCARLEALGVSAVVVEDKAGAKRTSLAADVRHELEDPDAFRAKIGTAQEALQSGDLLIFARIEALIAGAGLPEALDRAQRYLDSAADGLVIHSKDDTGEEVLEFMDAYRRLCDRLGVYKPLVCIPTAYNHIPARDLFDRGASIVIHGNHLVRAAYRAMVRTASTILRHDRSLEAERDCGPVADLFDLVGTGVDAGRIGAPSRST